jgi:hypothetical protein
LSSMTCFGRRREANSSQESQSPTRYTFGRKSDNKRKQPTTAHRSEKEYVKKWRRKKLKKNLQSGENRTTVTEVSPCVPSIRK